MQNRIRIWLTRYPWLKHLGVFGLYSLAFVFLTWPLVGSMSTSIVGFYGSDAPIFLWNAWDWQQKLSGGDAAFYTNTIFYPHSVSLILHTHTLVQSILVIGVNVVVRNLVLSFNLVYWLSAVAAAFFAYLFFLKKTKQYYASLLAGQFFGFQHLWAVYGLFGTQNIISFWYISAALCAYAYFQEKLRWWYVVLAGAVLGLASLNDFNMFAFTAAALGVYMVASHLLDKHSFKQIVRQWAIVAAAFAVVAGWNVVYIYGHAQEVAGSAIPSMADVDVYHADPINLIRPSRFHRLWPQMSTLFTAASPSQGNGFVGFTTFGIIVVAGLVWWRSKEKPDWKPFVVYGALFVVVWSLSFGPYLHVAGVATSVPMPYWFIGKLVAQFNNLRVPLRWLFPSMFFFAGLVACALQYVFRKVSVQVGVVLTVIFFVGFLYDSWLGPKQLLVVDSYPAVSSEIRARPGVVMELPLGLSSGFHMAAEGARINQLHQVVHGQPIVGGVISRAPKNFIESYETEAVMKYLLLYKTTRPDIQDTDIKNIQTFLATYDVRYIVFDKQLGSNEDEAGKALFDFITKQLRFTKFFEDSQFVAFTMK